MANPILNNGPRPLRRGFRIAYRKPPLWIAPRPAWALGVGECAR